MTEELREAYPGARFVHITRDPLENVASLKRLSETKGKGWGVHRIAWLLRDSLNRGLVNQERLGEDCYKLVRYEDLLERPKEMLCEIASFLGLEN